MTVYIAGQSNGGSLTRGDVFRSLKAEISQSAVLRLSSEVHGGTPLSAREAPDWYPFEDGNPDTGELLELMFANCRDATGIIWVQGESDSNSDQAANSYATNLRQLVFRFNEAYGDNIPIVIVALSTHADRASDAKYAANWATIREAQLSAGSFADNVIVIDPDAVAEKFDLSGLYRDGLHYNEQFSDVLLASALPLVIPDDPRLKWGSEGDDIIRGRGADEHINGSFGADRIFGGNGADYLDGGHGNDYLVGGGKNDIVQGSYGSDTLLGHAGDDILIGDGFGSPEVFGNTDNDRLFGNLGNDVLVGGAGDDQLFGGSGNDVFVFSHGFGFDKVMDYRKGDRVDARELGVYSLEDFDSAFTAPGSGNAILWKDGNKLVLVDTKIEDIVFLTESPSSLALSPLDASFLF